MVSGMGDGEAEVCSSIHPFILSTTRLGSKKVMFSLDILAVNLIRRSMKTCLTLSNSPPLSSSPSSTFSIAILVKHSLAASFTSTAVSPRKKRSTSIKSVSKINTKGIQLR